LVFSPAALPTSANRRRIEPTRRLAEAKAGAERADEQTRAASAVVQSLRYIRRVDRSPPALAPAIPCNYTSDDDAILAAAVEGCADYIVTGDQDLLAIGDYQSIRIVTPRAFLQRLNMP
jgi:predicted nucleic acid-binding protein